MKGLLLLSEGIDSPVAGYLMKNKGVELDAIHFDSRPFTDDGPLKKVKKMCKLLGINNLFTVKHGQFNQAEIIKNCNRKFTCVLCRRLMFRIAEEIARKENCDFLVTGENLGQVCSQTLGNLITAGSSINMKIMRPLLCFDKQDIVDMAKKIKSYEISIEPSICCGVVPKNPATNATILAIENQEENLNLKVMVKTSCQTVKLIKIV